MKKKGEEIKKKRRGDRKKNLADVFLVGQRFCPAGRSRRGNHHHHHHIVLAARISLTLSRHSSLSFIALGRSSGQQPVSSHSC